MDTKQNVTETYIARNKRNVTPYIVMNILFFLFALFVVIPDGMQWKKEFFSVQTLEKDLDRLDTLHESRQIVLKKKKQIFEHAAGDNYAKESKIFPSLIKKEIIARTLELFSLQLDTIDDKQDYVMELQSVSFGSSVRDTKHPYSKTDVSLKFDADKDTFRQFIAFLQDGTFPKRILQKEKIEKARLKHKQKTDFDFLSSLNFIKNNGLPLAHIQQFSFQEKKAGKFQTPVLSVNLNIVFFSEPL